MIYIFAVASVFLSPQVQLPDRNLGSQSYVARTSHAYLDAELVQNRAAVPEWPKGYFAGEATRTRFDFALLTDRALYYLRFWKSPLAFPSRKDFAPNDRPTIYPDEVQALKHLVAEFRRDLERMGEDVDEAEKLIQKLESDIKEIQAVIKKYGKELFPPRGH